MVSDIDIKKTRKFLPNFLAKFFARDQAASDKDTPIDQRWSASSNKISSLTVRIMSVNIIALMILGFGLLYLGQYTDSLIESELESMRAEARFHSAAVSEGAVRSVFQVSPIPFDDPMGIEAIKPSLARTMIKRLGDVGDSRVKLFSIDGSVLADSHTINGPAGVVEVERQTQDNKISFSDSFSRTAISFLDLIPMQTKLQQFPREQIDELKVFPNSKLALEGYVSAAVWKDDQGKFIVTAAAPVQRVKQVLGVVLLQKEGIGLENKINQIRVDVFRLFLGALGITVMLSIYLAELIGSPLKRLALAAESVRIGQNREAEIPDMSARGDEIGELSVVLRDMTKALSDRMDAIDSFAADVSHEIKNPLSSIRSAVETVERVKDEKSRKKLMGIINHDVKRLDRLITDISNSSRLDSELSREQMNRVDIVGLLYELSDLYKNPLDETQKHKVSVIIDTPQYNEVNILGNRDRLAQVFTNLITNAISFSPDNSEIHISIHPKDNKYIICVTDQGIGIPENKLETIFDRFYTERPDHENYGNHSGLGLSISKQIIEAHEGDIWAENAIDDKGAVIGAKFCVSLHAV